MTSLTDKDINDFWIKLYLNPKTDFVDACIDRAYRDFNRTMRGIGKTQSKEKYTLLKGRLKSFIHEILTNTFYIQADFDNWHWRKCDVLKSEFRNQLAFPLSYGQAQKWINMSLKYCFALGEDKVPGISKNYQFFHIPIDNIIQNKLLKENIQKFPFPWSHIDNYNSYLDYQKTVRNKFKGQIPMEVEFKLFNKQNYL
jgi:hypothetical protein